MADTYYAWSNFNTEVNEFGQPTETIMPGEKISQSDLECSDEEWEGLVESGAVRTEEYPEDLPPDMSPAEFYRQQEFAVASGQADDETKEAVELRYEEGAAAQEAPKEAPKPAAAAKAGNQAEK